MLSLAAWAGAEEDMVAVCVWERHLSKGGFGEFLGRAEGQSGPGSCMYGVQPWTVRRGGNGWRKGSQRREFAMGEKMQQARCRGQTGTRGIEAERRGSRGELTLWVQCRARGSAEDAWTI